MSHTSEQSAWACRCHPSPSSIQTRTMDLKPGMQFCSTSSDRDLLPVFFSPFPPFREADLFFYLYSDSSPPA